MANVYGSGKHMVGPRRNPKKKKEHPTWDGVGNYPRAKPTKRSTTGYRYVFFDAVRRKYKVEVKVPDKGRKFIGRFDCLETAKREADIAMQKFNPIRYPK